MYRELDDLLSEEGDDNYFYEYDCSYIEKLLEGLKDDDWSKLINGLHEKDDRYKRRLIYILEGETGVNGFNALLEIIIQSKKLTIEMVQALDRFTDEPYKGVIISDRSVMKEIKKIADDIN
ncbi:hypothetical protein VQ643_12810, partial [Pseudomonas sp. F1_0610]|uniref:hypothetical protein n=1 Tax=Pseudomonas sp. F1_0610 TaxID=3114284 RepID=UPI0039C0AC53